MDRQALEIIGTIGDVNPLDYGGGFVYRDKVGACSLEWYEPEDDSDEESDIICYRVDIDYGAESWMDLPAVAKSADHADIAEAIEDDSNPMRRALAFWSVAGHWGWHELDHYPLRLTRAEAEARIEREA